MRKKSKHFLISGLRNKNKGNAMPCHHISGRTLGAHNQHLENSCLDCPAKYRIKKKRKEKRRKKKGYKLTEACFM